MEWSAIYGTKDLNSGYKAWRDIKIVNTSLITFFKGNFYGVVFVCLIDDNKKPRAEAIAPPPSKINLNIKRYIVESSEDVLLV